MVDISFFEDGVVDISALEDSVVDNTNTCGTCNGIIISRLEMSIKTSTCLSMTA